VKKPSYLVTKENGVRPAGKQDECFYCHQKLDEEHKADCVLRRRTVVVKSTLEHVISVPEDWNEEEINFYLNESSSCTSNHAERIKSFFEYRESKNRDCYCFDGELESKFVREANEDDEDKSGVFAGVTVL
jgi:hypothetical protein